jgi:hypothetical protein
MQWSQKTRYTAGLMTDFRGNLKVSLKPETNLLFADDRTLAPLQTLHT